MLSRAEAKLLRGLHRRKVRESEGLCLAEGERVVGEVLASGVRLRLAAVTDGLARGARGRELVARLEAACPVRRVAEGVLAELAATDSPQGVVVAVETPRYDLDDVYLSGDDVLLVLDAVQDPGNFGAVVRSALAFGAAAAVSLPGTVDPWNPKAVRAAAGASFRLPLVPVTYEALFAWLEGRGVALYGADVAGEPVDRLELAGPRALAVGNEGAGLSDAVRSAADALVAVPMSGPAESLNVAVAAGIILYVMTRRR